MRKVTALRHKITVKKEAERVSVPREVTADGTTARRKARDEDESYHEDHDGARPEEDDEFIYKPRTKIRRPQTAQAQQIPVALQQEALAPARVDEGSEDELAPLSSHQTPRTKQLLNIINTKDVSQIKLLKGVGAKRAEAIVNCLCDLDDDARVTSLGQLGKLKGVGVKTVENMRSGVLV